MSEEAQQKRRNETTLCVLCIMCMKRSTKQREQFLHLCEGTCHSCPALHCWP